MKKSVSYIIRVTFKAGGEQDVHQYMVTSAKNDADALVKAIGYWADDYEADEAEIVKVEPIQKLVEE